MYVQVTLPCTFCVCGSPRNLELLWPQRDHKAGFARVSMPQVFTPGTTTDGSAVLSRRAVEQDCDRGVYIAVYNGKAPVRSLRPQRRTREKKNGTGSRSWRLDGSNTH